MLKVTAAMVNSWTIHFPVEIGLTCLYVIQGHLAFVDLAGLNTPYGVNLPYHALGEEGGRWIVGVRKSTIYTFVYSNQITNF